MNIFEVIFCFLFLFKLSIITEAKRIFLSIVYPIFLELTYLDFSLDGYYLSTVAKHGASSLCITLTEIYMQVNFILEVKFIYYAI